MAKSSNEATSPLDDLYKFNPDDGTIFDLGPLGMRFFMISSAGFASLTNAIYHNFGSGGYVILQGMAKEIGANVASAYDPLRDVLSMTDFVLKMCDKATNSGWGKITVSFKDNEIIFKVKNCIFCSLPLNEKQQKEREGFKVPHGCFIFMIISSMMSVLLPDSGNYTFNEEKCISSSDDACQIVIKRQKSRTQAL